MIYLVISCIEITVTFFPNKFVKTEQKLFRGTSSAVCAEGNRSEGFPGFSAKVAESFPRCAGGNKTFNAVNLPHSGWSQKGESGISGEKRKLCCYCCCRYLKSCLLILLKDFEN